MSYWATVNLRLAKGPLRVDIRVPPGTHVHYLDGNDDLKFEILNEIGISCPVSFPFGFPVYYIERGAKPNLVCHFGAFANWDGIRV